MLEIEPWYLLALTTTTDQISSLTACFRLHFCFTTMAFFTSYVENCFVSCSLQFDINHCIQVFFAKFFIDSDAGCKLKCFGFFNIWANMNIVFFRFGCAIRLKFDSNIFNVLAGWVGDFHGTFQLFVLVTNFFVKLYSFWQQYKIFSSLNKFTKMCIPFCLSSFLTFWRKEEII